MNLKIAETLCKSNVLVRCQGLIAKEDHLVVVEGQLEFRNDYIIKVSCEVNA